MPMRMQWWRDGVNGLYKGTPIRHPAIQCLNQVLSCARCEMAIWRPKHGGLWLCGPTPLADRPWLCTGYCSHRLTA